MYDTCQIKPLIAAILSASYCWYWDKPPDLSPQAISNIHVTAPSARPSKEVIFLLYLWPYLVRILWPCSNVELLLCAVCPCVLLGDLERSWNMLPFANNENASECNLVSWNNIICKRRLTRLYSLWMWHLTWRPLSHPSRHSYSLREVWQIWSKTWWNILNDLRLVHIDDSFCNSQSAQILYRCVAELQPSSDSRPAKEYEATLLTGCSWLLIEKADAA